MNGDSPGEITTLVNLAWHNDDANDLSVLNMETLHSRWQGWPNIHDALRQQQPWQQMNEGSGNDEIEMR